MTHSSAANVAINQWNKHQKYWQCPLSTKACVLFWRWALILQHYFQWKRGKGWGREKWKYGRGLVPIEANCINDDVPVKLIYDVTVNPLYPITPSQFNTDL